MIENRSPHTVENLTPDFIAELTPHRSLGRQGFIFMMVFITATCMISGVMFLVIGAWPVFLFFGLDVLVIWIAFKINYRDGRRKERVSVARGELKVEKVDPRGRVREYIFNPFWTKLEIDRHEEFGIMSMTLVGKNENLTIGSFLNPEDRASFAVAFNRALIQARC